MFRTVYTDQPLRILISAKAACKVKAEFGTWSRIKFVLSVGLEGKSKNHSKTQVLRVPDSKLIRGFMKYLLNRTEPMRPEEGTYLAHR